jgi:hypothetical protein
MPSVGFEPTTPVFERAKAVHALVHESHVSQSRFLDKQLKLKQVCCGHIWNRQYVLPPREQHFIRRMICR